MMASAVEFIAKTELGSDTSSVSFTSIPGTYQHLQIRASVRDTASAYVGSISVQLGGASDSPVDTGSNYVVNYIDVDGTSETGSGATSSTNISLGNATAASAGSEKFGGMFINILDYANTDKQTTVQAFLEAHYTAGNSARMRFTAGLWTDLEAVQTIKLIPNVNFATHSVFTLYGLKG